MKEKTKKRKLNTRWKKGGDRAPTADEKKFIFDRCYERPGFRHGARVYPVNKA